LILGRYSSGDIWEFSWPLRNPCIQFERAWDLMLPVPHFTTFEIPMVFIIWFWFGLWREGATLRLEKPKFLFIATFVSILESWYKLTTETR
jgi:hypothetical protein